jgi:hypothetical protein
MNRNPIILENWGKELKNAFPDWDAGKSNHDSWDEAVDDLQIGEEVSGTVVDRAPFGIFVDIGVGFPALLQIIMIREFDRDQYFFGDGWPIGADVKANIRGLGKEVHEIFLEQFPFNRYFKIYNQYLRIQSVARFEARPNLRQFWNL